MKPEFRRQIPDVWDRCVVCLGRGVVSPSIDRPAETCSHCRGAGEVPRQTPRDARRVR